jgi:PAS domain S-box-containing protein
MDTEGKVTYFNKFAEEFFGFDSGEIVGRSVVGTIVPPSDSAGQDMQKMIDDIVCNPERFRHNENENIRWNGETVRVMWANQALFDEDGRLRGVLCVGIDVTEEKKLQELRAKALKEQAAQSERTRLARDLHDAVSQTLFSASLVAEVLPRLWDRNEGEGRRRLEEVRQLTRGALAEMRTLLFELRPSALAEAELGHLLRQLGESVTGRARVPVTVNIDCALPFAVDTKIGLYRIAQEALNNVAKHSGAESAVVTLRCRTGFTEMSIADNGRGFDPATAAGKSLGLGIMNERATAIGATLTIRSTPGHGTEVCVVMKASDGTGNGEANG